MTVAWRHEQAIAEFPFLSVFPEHWRKIKQEYLGIIDRTQRWPETDLHNEKWDAYGILFKDQWLSDGCARCPVTTGLVKRTPGAFICGFSVMRAGCNIFPHYGYTSDVLRCHLGLVCPDGPYLQVADERLTWKEGDIFVFDDTAEHHAANPSAEDRVVLIVDFKKDHK